MCYNKIDKGSSITIQGLKCQLPPVGMGVHSVTGEVAAVDIIKRSKKAEDQYWEPPQLPEWYEEREEEEFERRKKNPDYIDPDLEAISEREWRRRMYGCWFYNNGKPVYLTGLNYVYLTYWQLDTGLPDFRIIDLEYFYFWEYCVHDPFCFGMIEVCKRRNGKTSRAACMMYECISRTKRALGGIQSKADEDAREIMELHLIPAFQQLPSFFRPQIDAQVGNTPKKELKFSTSSRGKASMRKINEKEQLRSIINYKSSKPKAYDGKKTKRLLLDESGKVETDVIKRHSIVKKCCVDQKRKVVGKMVVTSTVEELGIKFRFDELWKWSDPVDRQKDGATKSGLYRFFIPADRSGETDIYGYCDQAATRQQILDTRDSLRDEPSDYIDEVRKEPLTIEEAFRTASSKGHYNEILLHEQMDELSWKYDKKFWVRGNFSWENAIRDTKVIWEDSPQGRWVRCWNFEDLKETNKVIKRGNSFLPGNKLNFVAGCDPFDHNTVEDDGRASKGCSHVLRRHSPMNLPGDPFNRAFVCEYYFRADYSKLLYEDMIMQCVYFGCPILCEDNKPKIIEYFQDRHYGEFLIHLPGYKEPGIPSTPANKISMVEATEEYIVNHIKKVYYKELIKDWKEFKISETQKYDRAMSAGWTIVADMSYVVTREVTEVRDIAEYFRMYQAS
jgi:hypothetical protein